MEIRKPAISAYLGVFSSGRHCGNGLLQFPLNEPDSASHVDTETDVSEISRQATPIPRGRTQANVAIATLAIRIALPVFERWRMEIAGTPAEARQIRNCCTGFMIAHVLQDVVTHDEVELPRGCERIE